MENKKESLKDSVKSIGKNLGAYAGIANALISINTTNPIQDSVNNYVEGKAKIEVAERDRQMDISSQINKSSNVSGR